MEKEELVAVCRQGKIGLARGKVNVSGKIEIDLSFFLEGNITIFPLLLPYKYALIEKEIHIGMTNNEWKKKPTDTCSNLHKILMKLKKHKKTQQQHGE